MAATTISIYPDLIRIIDANNPDASGTAEILNDSAKAALIHFNVPDSIAFNKVLSLSFHYYTSPGPNGEVFLGSFKQLMQPFSAAVTYNTKPRVGYATSLLGNPSGYKIASLSLAEKRTTPNRVLGIGVEISLDPSRTGAVFSTSLTTNPPYLELTYDSSAVDIGYATGSPRNGGYVSKTSPTTFRWTYYAPWDIPTYQEISYSRFAYRKTAQAQWSFETAENNSYSAPAGMFSDTDTVYWYPDIHFSTPATLDFGNGYSTTTIEPAFTAVAVSPDSSYEDGSQVITFTWTASNSVGTTPSGADLQYSADGGTTWTDMGSVSGSALTYTAAANSLPGGQLSWRVRAINSESVAGAWSDPLSFINVAAPAAPSVNTDAAPFATITWDAIGQQAAEVVVDGVSYGVRFGAGKSFTLQQPLADGLHTAEVRIQGAYGLWSQFGSTAFTVANAAAGTIDLAAGFDVDARLQWSASISGSDFQIYRDGVQIGHTAFNTFTDRRALGTHIWYVLLRQEDGNYTKSNEVTGTLTTEAPVIAPLAGGPWISLRLTESSTTQQAFSYARTHTLRHYSGSPFPVIELTPYEDVAWTFQCAFAEEDEARSFEALRGQIVILKAYGMVMTGGLMNLNKGRNPFYLAYQFTIEQIAVEEVVDDPND